jgi:hypothetical protein
MPKRNKNLAARRGHTKSKAAILVLGFVLMSLLIRSRSTRISPRGLAMGIEKCIVCALVHKRWRTDVPVSLVYVWGFYYRCFALPRHYSCCLHQKTPAWVWPDQTPSQALRTSRDRRDISQMHCKGCNRASEHLQLASQVACRVIIRGL